MGFVSKRDDEFDNGLELIEPEVAPEEIDNEKLEDEQDCDCSCGCAVGAGDQDCNCDCLLDENTDEDEDCGCDDACAVADSAEKSSKLVVAKPVALAVLVAGIVIALIIGFFVGKGGFGQGGNASAILTEAQLDDTVASYTFKGKTIKVTAREALESMYSIEMFANEDGNYPHPSLEMISTYIRNQILLDYAQNEGIEATQEEISEYAMQILGTDDLAAISSAYQLSEERASQTLKEAVILQKLYESIVPPFEGEPPVAPVEPAEGDEDVATAEYAAYIIDILGDAWDKDADTWANTENDFYALLGEEEFNSEGATFNQANMAYYVAYNKFMGDQSGDQQAWHDFCNEVYADANMSIYGLFQ